MLIFIILYCAYVWIILPIALAVAHWFQSI
jgi:hypothetical protein